MSNASPTPEEILAAVESSGFLMEQDVASTLEDLGFYVWTARAYKDPEEGKSRELDVATYRQFLRDEDKRIYGASELLVECKNSSNPFVFMTRRKSDADAGWRSPHMRFPIDNYEAKKAKGAGSFFVQWTHAFEEFGFKEEHHFHKRATKAVQFARIDRSGSKWSANHAGLYDSIFLPLLKATKARWEETRPRGSGPEEWRQFRFLYPVVVIRGKIFEIDTSGSDRTPKEVPHIPFLRDLKMDGLEGRFLVDFVNEDHLEAFVREVVERNERIVTNRYVDHKDQVLSKERAWDETR